MAISTIYEVNKPTYKFYAVERAGYTNMASLVGDVITDMTKDGKFTFKAAKLTDENDFTLFTPEWPVRERLIKVNNPGRGYKIGNILEVPLATGANIKIGIANVTPQTGAVTELKIWWPGNYETPTIANTAAFFPPDWTPVNIALLANTSVRSNVFTVYGNVTSSVGVAPAIPSPVLLGPSTDTTMLTEYKANYGGDGGGGLVGSKWPANGIWFQANLVAQPAWKHNLFVGQEILLDSEVATNSANSVIPSGTRIVSITPMKYISGTYSVSMGPGNTDIYEKLVDGCYVIVSNPVTIKKGDVIQVRGNGLTIKNTDTRVPKAFRTIVEAEGAVDPINDPLGVTGDIRVSGTNSKYIEITNLQTPPNVPYMAEIYDGQTITSTDPAGSIGPGDSVFVSSVTWNGDHTIANVEMSRALSSFSAGETLQFVFDQVQPWRLCFDVLENKTFNVGTATSATNVTIRNQQLAAGSQALVMYAATEVQLTNTGNIANIWVANTSGVVGGVGNVTYYINDQAGLMGDKPSQVNATLDPNDPTEGFLNRALRVNNSPEAYPMNYSLSMTDRGVFFGVWEGTWSTLQRTKLLGKGGDSYFNWFVVQRPVNRTTGRVYTKGRAPVFCINCVGYKYWKFIVREEDVVHPTTGDPNNVRQNWDFGNAAIVTEKVGYRVPADANTQDSFAIINTTNQVALTEDSKYLVSFLHNLSTPRFRYSEELDMVGQTSADVCMAGTDIKFTAYSESLPRTYRALPANNPYNTGLRISVLKDIPQIEP